MPTRLAAGRVSSSGQADAAAAVVGPVDTGAVGPTSGVLVVVEMTVRVVVGDGEALPLEVHASSAAAGAARTAARNAADRMGRR